jgi:hypothetical protein
LSSNTNIGRNINFFFFVFSDIENKKPRLKANSAVALLNEMCSGLVYNLSDPIGPPHETAFSVTVQYPVSKTKAPGLTPDKSRILFTIHLPFELNCVSSYFIANWKRIYWDWKIKKTG